MELVNTVVNVANNLVGDDVIQTVNARELHMFLGVGKDFSTWIKDRIEAYDFTENQDYVLTLTKIGERRNVVQKDYFVSLDMAKELSMVDRGEKGKEVRKYFIQCEKAVKESLQRAPALPANFVEALEMLVVAEKQKLLLTTKVEELQPKAAFFDALTESPLEYTLSEVAKTLDTGRTRFARFLREQGYLLKDNTPNQRYVEAGLMVLKLHKFNDGFSVKVTPQPYFTGKGIIFFRKKLAALDNYLD